MIEDGEVSKAVALEVLECHDVEHFDDPTTPGNTVTVRGDVIDSKEIPEYLDRDLLQYYKRKFGVPMHHFYHPDVAQGYREERKVRRESAS